LVASLFTAILASSPALAHDEQPLRIGGRVSYDDDQPIRGANVLLLEGRAPEGSELPAFTPFARAVTDASGTFRFEVERKRAVIVELIEDECQWFSVRVSIPDEQLASTRPIVLNIRSKHDVCSTGQ
jgi:hypothetical protein